MTIFKMVKKKNQSASSSNYDFLPNIHGILQRDYLVATFNTIQTIFEDCDKLGLIFVLVMFKHHIKQGSNFIFKHRSYLYDDDSLINTVGAYTKEGVCCCFFFPVHRLKVKRTFYVSKPPILIPLLLEENS